MSNLGPGFYNRLLTLSSNVGMKPEIILNVMALESGLNPAAKNKSSGASGLVQFMPQALQGAGYKGSPADFRELSAERQLDYVERRIKDNIRVNNGQPFTSAAQYYVANFLPGALKIPGVKSEDPRAIIAAQSPTTPHIPGVSTKEEALIYRSNPALDVDKDGAITFGDIQAVMKNTASGHNYQQAIAEMRQHTGYEPSQKSEPSEVAVQDGTLKRYLNKLWGKEPRQPSTSPTDTANLNSILNRYLTQIVASDKTNKELYKELLTSNDVLININAGNYNTEAEFARVLCSVLETELLADACVHTNGVSIEVGCSISGPQQECLEAVKQMAIVAADAFAQAANKINVAQIKTQCDINKQSSYQVMSLKTAQLQHRKFLLRIIEGS